MTERETQKKIILDIIISNFVIKTNNNNILIM